MADTRSPKIFLEWQSCAYRSLQKSHAWYLWMGGILLLFIAYDLYSGGWVVSLTMLLLAGVYYLLESRPVPVLIVQITEDGVQYGRQFFPWDGLRSFWMLRESKTIHFKTQKGVLKEFSIFVPEELDTRELREYLALQIPEETGRKESFSDELIRNLGL